MEEYRADVADYLQAILHHAVETFPDRFKAVAVMGGMTTEWFDCSRGTESPARIEAWQKWRKEHGRPVIKFQQNIPAFSLFALKNTHYCAIISQNLLLQGLLMAKAKSKVESAKLDF